MAADWAWILVYVVGFCLFQVLLYRYLQSSETATERAAPDIGEGEATSGRTGPGEADESERDGVRCRHCGAVNEREQMFNYCRACARQIDGT